MRSVLAFVLVFAALAAAAEAHAATAPVPSCASLAGHACVLLQASSVLRSGVNRGIRWVLVRGDARGVKPGGAVVVGTGANDADGFAGVVIGITVSRAKRRSPPPIQTGSVYS